MIFARSAIAIPLQIVAGVDEQHGVTRWKTSPPRSRPLRPSGTPRKAQRSRSWAGRTKRKRLAPDFAVQVPKLGKRLILAHDPERDDQEGLDEFPNAHPPVAAGVLGVSG